MCETLAQWLRCCAVSQVTMGSNQAETMFLLLTRLLNPQMLKTVFFSKCVAKVATIFSLDRNETLDLRFDVLIFC